jgi:hypothetical protein
MTKEAEQAGIVDVFIDAQCVEVAVQEFTNCYPTKC